MGKESVMGLQYIFAENMCLSIAPVVNSCSKKTNKFNDYDKRVVQLSVNKTNPKKIHQWFSIY